MHSAHTYMNQCNQCIFTSIMTLVNGKILVLIVSFKWDGT